MTRILLTGASGYLGGAVLHQLSTSPPLANVEISCLNRDPKKAGQIRDAFPRVSIVQGDLDSIEIIQRASESADVVLHIASTKHVPSTEAILAGLKSKSRPGRRPGTFIQMSGASLFAEEEITAGRFGHHTSARYDDVTDISEILSLIESTPSRKVDQIIIAQNPTDVRTALIVGPLIYGVGGGPCQQRSIQVPEIARCTLALGHGVRLLHGENIWSNVHVADVASLITLLAEAAMEGKDVGWNREGIYNPENGAMKFGELSSLIAKEAAKQHLIGDAGLKEINAERADELSPHASVLWGTNAVVGSQRAQQKLGWVPRGHSLLEEVPDVVQREAKSMEL